MSVSLNFREIAQAALSQSRTLLPRWLPGGRWEGHEYVVKNPTRADASTGSFKINAKTGVWKDFAADGQGGGNLIALRAMLASVSYVEAAKTLAGELGFELPAPGKGLTLEAYAKAKHLSVPFLESLGVQTIKSPYGNGFDAVAIPYHDVEGNLIRSRLRSAISGERKFAWDEQRGKSAGLYGLNRRPESGSQIYLVEGESDSHTLWQRGIAALGLPGAGNFKPERDDVGLNGFQIIALIEPGQSGEAMLGSLRKSAHAEIIKVARLDGFKDVNELHCKAGDRFDAVLSACTLAARPLMAALKSANITRFAEGYINSMKLAGEQSSMPWHGDKDPKTAHLADAEDYMKKLKALVGPGEAQKLVNEAEQRQIRYATQAQQRPGRGR